MNLLPLTVTVKQGVRRLCGVDFGTGDIRAWDIGAWDIEVGDIGARDIEPRDIRAGDIEPGDIGAWDIGAGDIGAGEISERIYVLELGYDVMDFRWVWAEAILSPEIYIFCQEFQDKTLGNKSPWGTFIRMRNLVDGVENCSSHRFWNQGTKDTCRDITE